MEPDMKYRFTVGIIIVIMLLTLLRGIDARNVDVNNRPIIGILTEPTNSKYGEEYIQVTYVHYLEMSGARVVPVRGKQPKEYYEELFRNINGVLFPGGGADLSSGPFAATGRIMYDFAKEANDRGDYFPIWGTCLGLELLTVLTARANYLKHTDTENITLSLDFIEGYEKSRLFKSAPKQLIEYMEKEPVTQNNHQWSLLLEDFQRIPTLNKFYNLLSTSVGEDKKVFVSTFEAYNYPFYGVQWHPEKNIFYWNPEQAINHDLHAIEVTQYMADFFVNEARKSFHQYDSSEEEALAVIENSVRIYVPDFTVSERYYFNYTNNFFSNKYGTSLLFQSETGV